MPANGHVRFEQRSSEEEGKACPCFERRSAGSSSSKCVGAVPSRRRLLLCAAFPNAQFIFSSSSGETVVLS